MKSRDSATLLELPHKLTSGILLDLEAVALSEPRNRELRRLIHELEARMDTMELIHRGNREQ
jgi:hypothetical protein